MTFRPLLRPAVRTAGTSGTDETPAARSATRLAHGLRRPELLGLLALAAVLNLWALDLNGTANGYYAAAVRSMTESWHAFLYGSFDPTGVMTVDKPPLALWVQALSAKVFGFNSWALLGPQALMGVASVGLAYDLTRRRFGRAAGFAAGLTLALTPIAVAISRHNNPDALLVLCCVAALWFVVRALEDGRTRWLVLAAVAVGLGFEAKMLAALIVAPALAAAYLYVAPKGFSRAIRSLLAAGAALVATAVAWPLLIALTPASDRPWVSGTSDNSIWSLIFGYNGLGRVSGQLGSPGGTGGPGGGAGGVFGGPTGWLRLLDSSLGGQAGWLIGFAVVAALGLGVATRLRRSDARTGWLIAVGGAFATVAVVFSFAGGIFHPYYVSLLAPFTAALVGGGVGLVLQGGTTARVVAPLLVAGGVMSELYVIEHDAGPAWATTLVVVVGMVAAGVLAGIEAPRLRKAALAGVLAALLAAPASWAVQTDGHATSGTFPAGGPASQGMMGGPGIGGGTMPTGSPFGGGSSSLQSAIAYAKSHGGGTIAVASQMTAADAITASGADVAGIGGFSGRESAVTVDWLADAVQSGRIRWVLAESGGAMGTGNDGRTGATTVMEAVAATCKAVDGGTLYDCQGMADALRNFTQSSNTLSS